MLSTSRLPSQVTTTQPYPEMFTLFSKLPPELRNKVWTFAIPDPRVITMEAASNPTGPFTDRFAFFSSPPCFPIGYHPGMLSACTESRRIAEKVYAFKCCLHRRFLVPFDTSRDIVFIGISTLSAFLRPRFGKCPRDNLEKIGIRSLALGPLRNGPVVLREDILEKEHLTYENLHLVLRRAIQAFKTLEEIIFCWVGEGGETVVAGLESSMQEDSRKVRNWVDAQPGWKLSEDSKVVEVPRFASLRFGTLEDLEVIRDKLVSRKMFLDGS